MHGYMHSQMNGKELMTPGWNGEKLNYFYYVQRKGVHFEEYNQEQIHTGEINLRPAEKITTYRFYLHCDEYILKIDTDNSMFTDSDLSKVE